MKKSSISANLIYQFLYQVIILVIPMVVSPYLTRILGSEALGVYAYSNSIAYYFVILSMLGISRYGQRTISQNSYSEIAMRKAFWSLFTVHVIISIIVTFAYIFFVVLYVSNNKAVYYIQTFYVLSALFDITWLFYGLENFKSVVIKNAAIKILETIFIFILIKDSSDLAIYALITTLGLLLGQIVMLPQAIRLVKPIRFTFNEALQHIKPLLILSISVIAVSLYTVFDKTLLGILSTKQNVAYYEYSNRIINVPKAVIGVIGTVMFPRACRLVSVGDSDGQRKYIDYSVILTAFIGLGSMFGLLAVGKPFAILYYGKSFSDCGGVIMALSPLIFIIGVGDIIRTQYMIPNKMDIQYNVCLVLNAIVNIILSLTLIPVIGIYGAVVGTVAAETFGLMYQVILCRKNINPISLLKDSLPFAFIGLVMFLFIKMLEMFLPGNFAGLLIEIVLGALVYCLLSLAYLLKFKEDLINPLLKSFVKKNRT